MIELFGVSHSKRHDRVNSRCTRIVQGLMFVASKCVSQ